MNKIFKICFCFAMVFIFSCSGLYGVDGEPGVNGKDGKDGKNGVTCEIKTAHEDSGHDYEIFCGWTFVGYLDNGAIGPQGEPGLQGDGCRTMNDHSNSAYLVMVCGSGETVTAERWPKAMCEAVAYDPETHCCSNNGIVMDKCNFYDSSASYLYDGRDGKIYKWVNIGEQTWMAENLNYYSSNGKSVCYNNSSANCREYGRLYDWATAMADICPKGWHLPTNNEWETLIATVGGFEMAGRHLKATSGWNNDGNGIDDYGFAALPGGRSSSNLGSNGYWWSASSIYGWTMEYNNENVGYKTEGGQYFLSVRCVKN
jgi:uncharacterized protein (TIGR02145 family)